VNNNVILNTNSVPSEPIGISKLLIEVIICGTH